MQFRDSGTLTLQNGRRTLHDGIIISENAALDNRAELYTHDFVSEGTITGDGTIWAHISSKPIGGVISTLQVIIYYPVDKSFVLPIVFGALVSMDNILLPEGSLT
jgi:hypothetical protein